jgi:hypothetical protein
MVFNRALQYLQCSSLNQVPLGRKSYIICHPYHQRTVGLSNFFDMKLIFLWWGWPLTLHHLGQVGIRSMMGCTSSVGRESCGVVAALVWLETAAPVVQHPDVRHALQVCTQVQEVRQVAEDAYVCSKFPDLASGTRVQLGSGASPSAWLVGGPWQ